MQDVLSTTPLFTNDAVVFGCLMTLLMLVFKSTQMARFKGFYKIVPSLLLCYFLPSLLNTAGLISPAWIDWDGALAALQSLGHDSTGITSLSEMKDFVAGLAQGPKTMATAALAPYAGDLDGALAALQKLELDTSGLTSFGDIKDYVAQLPVGPSEQAEAALAPLIGKSQLYFVASRYLLPASLVLLTLSVDLKEVLKLGPKALIMFGTAAVGVILGAPVAILLFNAVAPEVIHPEGGEEVWRGLTTVAGSWIGGGANQAAMYEIFGEPENPPALISGKMFGIMITIDVLVAELWMFFLLLGVGKADAIDRKFKADASAVKSLRDHMHEFSQRIARIPSFNDLMIILGIGFLVTGLAHVGADTIGPWVAENAPELKKFSLTSGFFWLIVIATTAGLILSFTPARQMEGAGASRVGSVFIYILVATIGMKMNVLEIFDHPGLFLVGLVWMSFHVGLLFLVGWLIKAPYFFLAVGSKANIGGAASAPVVAAAFHPSLAPVGVLLAVLGYALGTYGAWLCGILMEAVY